MNRSKQLTDGALLTAIFIVLLLITMFVPVGGIIATFLLPVPFIIFASRYNWKPSLLMLAATMVLSAIFATVFAVPAPLFAGIGGIMIGCAIYKGLSAYETWARGTVGFVIGLVLIFMLSQLLFHVNMIDEMDAAIDESLQLSKGLMENVGLGDQAKEQFALVQEQMKMMLNLIPALMAIMAIILAFVSQWLSYKVLNRLEKEHYHFPAFRNMQLPVSLVWIYFFAVILSLFEMDPNGMMYLAVQNVLVLTGLLIAVQGFSFIFFYAHHKKMSKALPIASVIVVLLFSFFLLYLVRILGIIDLGYRLRDRINGKNK